MVMGNLILDSEFFALQFNQTEIVGVGPQILFVNCLFEGGMFHMQ